MKPKLLIWSKNPGKIKRRSQYFWDQFDILSLKDCWIEIEVEESMDDLRGNSIKKATTYAKLSWHLTLSEDTGFFIEELWWLPWVAVRRRWWELPNEISDEDFLAFFKEKIKELKDTRSYFEYDITIATPDWTSQTINKKAHWHIDRDKLHSMDNHRAWYPLSQSFINDIDWKTRIECSDEERAKRDEHIIKDIRLVLENIV